MDLQVFVGSAPWHRAAALYVRYKVFVLERGIAREDEFDHLDEKGRVYALVCDGKEPISTGRFVKEDETSARLTRIATLKEHRGKGNGAKIIHALEEYAREQKITNLVIHAELTAKTFYENLGYTAISEVYEEDGEACQSLSKTLKNT